MSEHHCDVVTLDGINNISVGTEFGCGRWCSPRQKSLVPDSPFRELSAVRRAASAIVAQAASSPVGVVGCSGSEQLLLHVR